MPADSCWHTIVARGLSESFGIAAIQEDQIGSPAVPRSGGSGHSCDVLSFNSLQPSTFRGETERVPCTTWIRGITVANKEQLARRCAEETPKLPCGGVLVHNLACPPPSSSSSSLADCPIGAIWLEGLSSSALTVSSPPPSAVKPSVCPACTTWVNASWLRYLRSYSRRRHPVRKGRRPLRSSVSCSIQQRRCCCSSSRICETLPSEAWTRYDRAAAS